MAFPAIDITELLLDLGALYRADTRNWVRISMSMHRLRQEASLYADSADIRFN